MALALAILGLGPAAPAWAVREYDERAAPPAAAEPDAEGRALAYEVDLTGIEDPGLGALLEASSQLIALRERPPDTLAGLERRARGDLERIGAALRSEGYYAARASFEIDEKARPLAVSLQVVLGPLYRLADVEIDYAGSPAPAGGLLPSLAELGLALDMPARAPDILAAERRLPQVLAERGYPLAKVTERKTFVQHPDKTMTVALRVDAGPKSRFGPVTIRGNESVDGSYLRRLLTWREGEIYDRRKVAASRRALINTNLFALASLRPDGAPDADGLLPMLLEVTERPHRSIGFGVTWSTDVGFGAEVFWEHRNLFGANERLRLAGIASEIRQGVEATFRKPHHKIRDQLLRIDYAFLNEDTDAFDGQTMDGEIGVDRPWQENWVLGVGVSGSLADIRDEREDVNSALAGLPLSAVRDTSNDRLNPTAGIRLDFALTPYAGVNEADGVTFISSQSQLRAYHALDAAERFVLAGRLKVGWMAGEERRNIPANKRFYAGGGGSIRGYEYQLVGPLNAKNDPLGGRSLFETSAEVRIRATETIGIVPFLDGGNVFGASFPDFEDKLRWAAGLGVRYFTAVGPLRLDIAFPLNPRDRVDDDFQFYVSFGQAF